MRTKVIFLFLDILVLGLLIFKALSYPIQNFKSCQHFIYLSEAFLKGKFYIDKEFPCFYDVILKNGKIFLPFGPAPAILLMPIVAVFGHSINEVILSVLSTIINALLVYSIVTKLGVRRTIIKIWYIILFILGSLYFIYFHWEGPWSVSHAVSVMFLLAAIERSLRRKQEFLAGIFFGAAFLTRTPIIFSLPFFLIVWFSQKDSISDYFKRIFLFFAGIFGPLFFLFWYNFARFGNIFESGYSFASVGAPVFEEARKIGLFSFLHIPKNIYVMLFKGLDAIPNIDSPILESPYISSSPWGMSIFLSTPALVYIFSADIKKPLVFASWIAILLVSLPLITYYGIGYAQFGYRYSLDFFPFLFLLTILGIKDDFTFWPRFLIILGVLINTYWK